MRLTKDQYAKVKEYERFLESAVVSRWSRNPGAAALKILHEVHGEVTGIKARLNTSCPSCILRLLTELGNIYFADKEELAKKKKKK